MAHLLFSFTENFILSIQLSSFPIQKKKETMKKPTTTERKWRLQVKQLLVALKQEINIAYQIQSLKDLEIFINQTEFQ
ncbi:MAG: hypothetical protein D4R43_02800 [Sphingobacteriales bacterium]|nr:MAG: hypothetical protein D4R43_02800 [Sphingobacteriales bacterium]